MAFEDLKITASQIAAKGIQSRPNKLTGTAAENKAAFDALVSEVIMPAFNGLLTALQDAGAAAQIGVDSVTGLTATKLQAALEEIMQSMQEITQGSVADGSITTAKLADGAASTGKLAAGAVTTEKLADGAVTGSKIPDRTVTAAKIALGCITAALLSDGAVTADKLGAGAVTGAKIGSLAVDSTKLAAEAVTTPKLADGAVTAAKIGTGAVTAAKIGTGAVTADKLGTLTYAAVGLNANQVRVIKIGTDDPEDAGLVSGDIYLKIEGGN